MGRARPRLPLTIVAQLRSTAEHTENTEQEPECFLGDLGELPGK